MQEAYQSVLAKGFSQLQWATYIQKGKYNPLIEIGRAFSWFEFLFNFSFPISVTKAGLPRSYKKQGWQHP